MAPLDEKLASRGTRVDFHVHLYADELAVIDAIATKYDCSRSAVVAALTEEYRDADLGGRIEPGRRPGGGRKPKPKEGI